MAEQSKSRSTQGKDRGRRTARGWRKETFTQGGLEKENYQPTIPIVVEEGFDSPEWTFQLVEEGIPVLLEASDDLPRIRDRRGRNLNRFFPELIGPLRRLPSGTILDADIVCGTEPVEPHERQFQSDEEIAESMSANRCVAIVHDLLSWNGVSRTTATTGVRRRELVEQLSSLEVPAIIAAVVIEASGLEAVRIACETGHPSVRAKMKGSPYPGRETRAWREIPCDNGSLLVAGALLDPDFDEKCRLRLLSGAFEKGRLIFQRRLLVPDHQKRTVLELLRPLTRGQQPFHENPGWLPGLHWLAPEMVVQVDGAHVIRARPDLCAEHVHPRARHAAKLPRRMRTAGDPLRLQKRLRFSA